MRGRDGLVGEFLKTLIIATINCLVSKTPMIVFSGYCPGRGIRLPRLPCRRRLLPAPSFHAEATRKRHPQGVELKSKDF